MSTLVVAALSSCHALAQQEAAATLEEIVVVGTRRQGRTALETAVPVDFFNRQEIDSVSSDDMLDIIKTLVPSFQVPRYAIADGATFVRPPQLRGMSADKILVLVNGKRRHRSAFVQLHGDGVHAADLSTIPSIALKSVEVLRDGASALYGSDAIAGVFNFNLRDTAEGGEIRLQAGEYKDGNEDGYLLSLNQGLRLGKSGFVNISVEVSDNDATSRGTYFGIPIGDSGLSARESAQVSGLFDHDLNPSTPDQQRYGPDALTELYDPSSGLLSTITRGSDGIPDDTDTRYADNLSSAEITDTPYVMVWGEPEREAIRTFINAGLELDGGAELYGWVNYSDSDSNSSYFHRLPDASVMVPLRTASGEIYNPRDDLYPAGFTPRFAGDVDDAGITGGIRGTSNNGMSYDVGGRWGESKIKYKISNTMNHSLGPATPTSFRPGDQTSDEWALNADFAKPLEVGFASDLNVAFGFEYRDEGYELHEGNLKSHEEGVYAYADPFNFETDADEAAAGENGGSVGCFIPGPQFDPASLCHPEDPIHNVGLVGSNGFPGYGPETASTYDRDSWAAYLDLEADITDRFLASVAGRYEDFSDFGDNFSWRIAARLQVNDILALRGSAGTGFRAPTPGQISSTSLFNWAQAGAPVTIGLFPPQHSASQLFGAAPLKDETSTQFTVGLALEPTDTFTMALDYYFIALDDRIWVSSNFDVSEEEREELVAQGVPGADQKKAVRFFTNDIDTETSGIDLVANYNIDWSGGYTTFSLAGNVNETKVTNRTNRQTDPMNPTPVYYLSDWDVFRIENGDPDYRVNFTTMHSWTNGVSATLRGNWYGDYEVANMGDVTETQTMSGDVYWDIDLTWDVSDTLSLTLGGNNVFDASPDSPPDFIPPIGAPTEEGTVMDWQGPYYYARGVFRWN